MELFAKIAIYCLYFKGIEEDRTKILRFEQ